MSNSPSIAKTCIVEFENWWNTNLVLLRMRPGGTSIATFTPRGSSTQPHSLTIILLAFTFHLFISFIFISKISTFIFKTNTFSLIHSLTLTKLHFPLLLSISSISLTFISLNNTSLFIFFTLCSSLKTFFA